MAEPDRNTVEEAVTAQAEETALQSNPAETKNTTGETHEEEKIQNERPSRPKISLCTKWGITHPVCHSRTEFCQHDFGCLENIIKGTLRSFGIGYGIKTGLSLIGLLIGFKKLLKK